MNMRQDSGLKLDVSFLTPPQMMRRRIVIGVPYRNRPEQLKKFLARLPPFLEGCGSKSMSLVHIIIAEQSCDGNKFNRGAMLNASLRIDAAVERALRGSALSRSLRVKDVPESGIDDAALDPDSFISHDVDLIPEGGELRDMYLSSPSSGVAVHLAALWGRYSSRDYVGGVLCLHPSDYRKVNGYPNRFWGWGGEDDALRTRMNVCGVRVHKPRRTGSERYTDLESMTLKQKLDYLRANRHLKNMRKWEDGSRDAMEWQQDGYNSVRFVVTSVERHKVNARVEWVKATVKLKSLAPCHRDEPRKEPELRSAATDKPGSVLESGKRKGGYDEQATKRRRGETVGSVASRFVLQM